MGKIFLHVLVTIFLVGYYPIKAESLNGEEVLKKAVEISRKAETVKKTSVEKDRDVIITTTIYERRLPDGVKLTRRESSRRNAKSVAEQENDRKKISIRNKEGSWEIVGRTAIKKEYLDGMSKKIAEGVSKEFSDERGNEGKNKYAISEVLFNENPSYLVTEHISEEGIANAEKAGLVGARSIGEHNPDIFLKTVPAVITYTIRKSDYAVLSRKEFNKSGDKIYEVVYQDVVFGLPLAQDLFEISNSYKIKNAKNILEYIKIKKEASE